MTLKQTQQILRELEQKKMSLQSDESVRWLAQKMSTIQTEMRQSNFIDKNSPLRRNKLVEEGQMVFFGYSPLTKNELMFWDEYPIVVVLQVKRSGILGLNLHYLPFEDRAKFLANLRSYIKDPRWIENMNNETEFFLTYRMAKNSTRLKDFRKCIKRYYFNRMMTRIAVIKPTEWLTVPFFPLDKFRGMSRGTVWNIVKSLHR